MTEQAGISIQQIVEKVWLSIAERRLRPGVQLKEGQMAAIFDVSRARIRQALAALEREGLVTIIPNRGAFVCQPTVDEARDVFTIRRSVESRVVARIGASVTKADLARLRSHVAQERTANTNDATTDIIKLSGGFHLLLAEQPPGRQWFLGACRLGDFAIRPERSAVTCPDLGIPFRFGFRGAGTAGTGTAGT